MCEHLTIVIYLRAHPVLPSAQGCQECMERGDSWVHLRLCLTCGHVGCCDDSPNKHATAHFRATGHPVVKSFEPGEDWAWCYIDHEFIESMGAFPAESAPVHYAAPALARHAAN